MQKWEYSMLYIQTGIRSELLFVNSQGGKQKLKGTKEEELILHFNQLGQVGWEVVSSTGLLDSRLGTGVQRWIFRRPIHE